MKIFLQRIKTFFLFFLLLLNFIPSLPINSKVYFLEADYYQDKTQQHKIVLGKGEIISSDKVILRVAVSDPSIADIQMLNEKQIFVRGKQFGTCTFLIWEKGKLSPSRFDISVWPNIDELTTRLQKLDKNITVEFVPPSNSLASMGNGGPPSESTAPPSTSSTSSAFSAASSATGGSSDSASATVSSEKIILTGAVANAETIAKALQIAGAYVNDQGIKIISQSGGLIIDGLSGNYNLQINSGGGTGTTGTGSSSATGGGGGSTQFGGRDQISFVNNSHANLSRGVIVTTQNGRVLSFLTVKDPPQIAVSIRFYEISRSLSRDLGFNQSFGGNTLHGGSFLGGNGLSQVTGGVTSSNASNSTLSQAIGPGVTGAIFNPENGIGLIIQALQQRGEVKALAEPTLVISNNEPASFLAGGEVPIQRSVITNGGTSQDISYEPFGIRFLILPTITPTNRIHLQLVPEIRDIDTELSSIVAPASSTILRPPSFKTRRTQTQVELESGEAFAISGLLREDNTRSIRKVPGVGDIPVLGSLFRSKSFRKGQTELLIVVSPKIVKPNNADKLAELSRTQPVPYNEFNELPPIKKPFKPFDLHDEKGPEFYNPLDAARFNTEAEKQMDLVPIPLKPEQEEVKEILPSVQIPQETEKDTEPVLRIQQPATNINPPIQKQEINKTKPIPENQPVTPAVQKEPVKDLAPNITPEITKEQSEAETKNQVKKTKKKRSSKFKKDLPLPPLAPLDLENSSTENSFINFMRLKISNKIHKTKNNRFQKIIEENNISSKKENMKAKEEERVSRKAKSERLKAQKTEERVSRRTESERLKAQKVEERVVRKAELERLKAQKKEEKIAKLAEKEIIARQNKEKEFVEAYKRSKSEWKEELERFNSAQEAMKRAREGKLEDSITEKPSFKSLKKVQKIFKLKMNQLSLR